MAWTRAKTGRQQVAETSAGVDGNEKWKERASDEGHHTERAGRALDE